MNNIVDSALPQQTNTLPIAALMALAMTGFICIFTETIPAGLLPQISENFAISQAMAGQMVTLYALGSLLAAIPLTLATQTWPRRHVLLLTLIGFLFFNTITAFSTDYLVTLVSRFFAGASAGLAWSLLAGYARRMVQPHQQGKAMAIAMVGTPIALSLGVPLGTWMGGVFGWRTTFLIMSAFTVILMLWVVIKVPNYAGQSRAQSLPILKVLMTPGVIAVLTVVLLWILAHNILYTYITAFVALAGLGNQVDIILFVFGLTALIGIWVSGRTVDQYLHWSVMISLILFAFVSLALGLWSHSIWIVYISTALWGISFGGSATFLQTALADSAKEGADIALSMNVVIWNSAIAAAGLLGAMILEQLGAAYFPWFMLLLIVIGIFVVYCSKHHGFKLGARHGE